MCPIREDTTFVDPNACVTLEQALELTDLLVVSRENVHTHV